MLYTINNDLILREDDNSAFSLNRMEVYEFNPVGFKAIMIMQKYAAQGLNYENWYDKIKSIDDIDLKDIKDFWDNLISLGIFQPLYNQ